MRNTKILAIFMVLLGGLSQMAQAGPTGVAGSPPLLTAPQPPAGQMLGHHLGAHPVSSPVGARMPSLASSPAPLASGFPSPATNPSAPLMDPSLMADTSEGGAMGEAGLEDMGASSEALPASETPATLINSIIEKATELKRQIAPETAALEEGMNAQDMAALQQGTEGTEGSEGLMPAGGTPPVGPHPSFAANGQNVPPPPHLAPKPQASPM